MDNGIRSLSIFNYFNIDSQMVFVAILFLLIYFWIIEIIYKPIEKK